MSPSEILESYLQLCLEHRNFGSALVLLNKIIELKYYHLLGPYLKKFSTKWFALQEEVKSIYLCATGYEVKVVLDALNSLEDEKICLGGGTQEDNSLFRNACRNALKDYAKSHTTVKHAPFKGMTYLLLVPEDKTLHLPGLVVDWEVNALGINSEEKDTTFTKQLGLGKIALEAFLMDQGENEKLNTLRHMSAGCLDFSITFSGDSVGLPHFIACLSFLFRIDIPADTAFTGTIGPLININGLSLNEKLRSLGRKIEMVGSIEEKCLALIQNRPWVQNFYIPIGNYQNIKKKADKSPNQGFGYDDNIELAYYVDGNPCLRIIGVEDLYQFFGNGFLFTVQQLQETFGQTFLSKKNFPVPATLHPAVIVPQALPELGNWKILAEIAVGRFGRVYKYVDRQNQSFGALKIFNPGAFAQEDVSEAKQRFLRGMRIQKSLDHPNIVKVYETSDDKAFLFYVDKDYQKELDDRRIPDKLREEFASQGHNLSQNTEIVEIKKRGKEWVIHDSDKVYSLLKDHRYLFSMDVTSEQDLVSELSSNFNKKFPEEKPVSQDAKVNIETLGIEWIIEDSGNQREYLVKKREKKLEIYETRINIYDDLTPPYFVMQYIEKTLLTFCQELYQRCPIERPFKTLVSMASQICDALVYLDNRGLRHCDLSLNNILVQRDNNGIPICFITDFDIAQGIQTFLTNTEKFIQGIKNFTRNLSKDSPRSEDFCAFASIVLYIFNVLVPGDVQDNAQPDIEQLAAKLEHVVHLNYGCTIPQAKHLANIIRKSYTGQYPYMAKVYEDLSRLLPLPMKQLKDMVFLGSNVFEMGDGQDDDNPKHVVSLSSFYISEVPVTYEVYQRFLEDEDNAGWRKDGKEAKEKADKNYLKDWDGDSYPESKKDHPVVYVSWHAAQACVRWLTKHLLPLRGDLPTEAQWEFAAKGGMDTPYWWGEECKPEYANYLRARLNSTTEVRHYKPNPYNIYDMLGNVWEWCRDWYDAKYYTSVVYNDPLGPTQGTKRVCRGGSFEEASSYLRVACRKKFPPLCCQHDLGFRYVILPEGYNHA